MVTRADKAEGGDAEPLRRPNLWIGPVSFAAGILVFCTLCVVFVDRPVSTWVHAHLSGERGAFDSLTHVLDPTIPLAIATLLIAVIGYRLELVASPWMRALVTCALAAVIVVMVKEQAKFAFGRFWPETWVDNNPSWIRDGAYGFHPFHGGRGYASFPSGHMAIITAPVTASWWTLPRFRLIACILPLLVAVGLLGADYHFLSDIAAGTALGWLCGYGALAVVSRSWVFDGRR